MMKAQRHSFSNSGCLSLLDSLLGVVVSEGLEERTHLGRFEIGDQIGSGGMADVYEGFHGGQTVALKVARDDDLGGTEWRRFYQEAAAMRALSHPNIVSLVDISSGIEGPVYMAQERIAGATLRAAMRRADWLLADRLRLFVALCDAVNHMHDRQVLHRDLKPANVMVDPDGQPVIIDFGIAEFMPEGRYISRRKVALMTQEYAAPEQFVCDELRAQADLYQLGVMLHELVFGERPFQRFESALADFLWAIHHPDETLIVREHADLSDAQNRALEQVIRRCLDPDPARRHENAGQIAQAIKSIAPGNRAQSNPRTALAEAA